MTAETCPACSVDLRGPQIPQEYIDAGHYGPSDDDSPRYYSRLIGIEVRGVYDGMLFWQCPDCGAQWHRWPEGHRLRVKAAAYMERAVSA